MILDVILMIYRCLLFIMKFTKAAAETAATAATPAPKGNEKKKKEKKKKEKKKTEKKKEKKKKQKKEKKKTEREWETQKKKTKLQLGTTCKKGTVQGLARARRACNYWPWQQQKEF